MASIVQFLHLGGEHGPDPKSSNFKSWNRKQHLRKFMSTKLILFGSNKKVNGVHHFLLDTVLVVKSRVLYNPGNNPLTNQISNTYGDIVYTKAFQYYTENLNLTLYLGANFENKKDGMFSFVPSKIYISSEDSFPRVSVPGSDYIATGMITGYKETQNL